MSTKTSIKRIALVAVSALGFGVMSVVPAFAGAIDPTVTAVNTADAASNAGATATPYPQGAAFSTVIKANPVTTDMATGDVLASTLVVANPLGTDITASVTIATSASNTTAAAALDAQAIPSTSGAVCSLTATGGAVTKAQAYPVCTVTFPAAVVTVPGVYTITSTTAFTAGGTNTKGTATELAASIYVSGSGVTQGLTRSINGTAVTNGAATVKFVTPTHSSGDTFRVFTSGVGSISGVTSSAGTDSAISGVAGDYSKGISHLTASANSETVTLNLSSAAAGNQTIDVYSVNNTTGVTTLVAESIVSWAAGQAVSAGNSTAWMSDTNVSTAFTVAPTANIATAVYGAKTLNAQAATILVTVKDQYNLAMTGQNVKAEVSGSGTVAVGTTETYSTGPGRSIVAAANAGASANQAYVNVFGDGTAGVGTVSIYAGTATTGYTLLATRTVNFYGATATLTSAARGDVWANGNTTTAAFTVTAKDSGGNLVQGVNLTAAPSNDISIITGWSCVARSVTSYPGQYRCTATGYVALQYGKVAPVFQDDQAVPVKSNAASITVGKKKISSLTMAFDKKSYAPGEEMTLTITAKDDAGNPVADVETAGGAYSALYTMKSNLGTSTSLSGVVDGAFGAFNDEAAAGTQTVKIYAPIVSGTFTVTASIDIAAGNYGAGRLAAALYGADITASATVTAGAAETAANAASDAALQAIDAANAATDAANLAAEAADAATMAAQDAKDAADAATAAVEKLAQDVATMIDALKAQLATLANVVAKIAKKVKA